MQSGKDYCSSICLVSAIFTALKTETMCYSSSPPTGHTKNAAASESWTSSYSSFFLRTHSLIKCIVPCMDWLVPFVARGAKQVTADQLAADEQQAIVEKDVSEANKVAANVQVIKDDCKKVRIYLSYE